MPFGVLGDDDGSGEEDDDMCAGLCDALVQRSLRPGDTPDDTKMKAMFPAYTQFSFVGEVGAAAVVLFGGLLPSLASSFPPRRVAERMIVALVPSILLMDWFVAAVMGMRAWSF
eukprot:gene31482-44942_t